MLRFRNSTNQESHSPLCGNVEFNTAILLCTVWFCPKLAEHENTRHWLVTFSPIFSSIGYLWSRPITGHGRLYGNTQWCPVYGFTGAIWDIPGYPSTCHTFEVFFFIKSSIRRTLEDYCQWDNLCITLVTWFEEFTSYRILLYMHTYLSHLQHTQFEGLL